MGVPSIVLQFRPCDMDYNLANVSICLTFKQIQHVPGSYMYMQGIIYNLTNKLRVNFYYK